MARIEKVKQILAESLIPDHAPSGTVFIAKDTQSVWLAVRSGEVLNLSDILDGKYAGIRTPARDGKDGAPGASIKGDRGEPGRDGVCACKKGLDSTVPGPRGEVGPAGAKGDTGDRGTPGPDTAAAIADYFTGVAALRTEVAALRVVADGLVAQHKNTGEYCAWLLERAAARRKQ